ncbi:MAG: HDOD domain-containing protein [Planctomycetes bacterium]|nr:HDOD domain-containing protein [Planctomycetota bacterium]
MKNILFVDDEPRILSGLKRMLHAQRGEWNMTFVEGGAAALEELAKAPCDVVISDMRMPGMDGAALLAEVRRRHPSAVRIVLSGYTDLATAMRTVHVAHQFLTKPCESETLREVVTRACNLRDLLAAPGLAALVGQIDSLPPAPRVYHELTTALLDPDVPIERIATVVEQDYAICAKILQVVNSSFFALPRSVSSIRQAISYLGVSMLKSLVLTVEVFRQFEGSSMPSWFSFEEEIEHATLTAALARRLLPGKEAAENAHTAAMLHDTGRLIFAVKAPDAYRAVVEAAGERDRPHCAAERTALGASHAEVGAYLLGIWGIPYPIIEAVAFHEEPARTGSRAFDVVGAVHVADALAREVAHGTRAPPPDAAYLGSVGRGEESLAEWRALARRLAAELGVQESSCAQGGGR